MSAVLNKSDSKGQRPQIYKVGAISADSSFWTHDTLFFKIVAIQNTIHEAFWETDMDFILSKVFSIEIGWECDFLFGLWFRGNWIS